MQNRLIFLLIICICLTLTNCGPRATEIEATRIADSTGVADSLMKLQVIADKIDLSTNAPKDKKFIKTGNLKFKVKNVLDCTEKIEDISTKYGGYITYSKLENQNEDEKTIYLCRDSSLISKQIVVNNEIKLRVPNARLDSFIRELNPLVLFFDYRIINLIDVSLFSKSIQKKSERLQKYEQNQLTNIKNKSSKLKETTIAENTLLDRQNQKDNIQIDSMAIEDQVKYCDLTILIYQKPIIVKEVIANFDYFSSKKPNFFVRVWDSVIKGWWILEEVVVYLINIWGIALLVVIVIFVVKYLTKFFKKN